MALSAPDGSVTAIPARAREVYDVTGAGDTVLAFFGLGLAAGIPAAEAAQIANIAAGVKIGKIGTAAVGPAEILAWSGSEGGAGKAAGLSEAAARVEHERSRGRRIVFTNGCFDLLHAGHIDLLEKARALGDFLVVAVNSDASVRRLKGDGRPLVGQEDRVRVLGALDAVDLVLIFDEDTPLDAIHRIHPDILVKGGDYSTETIVGHEFVLGYGGRVETIPLVSGRSTSALIDAIRRAGER
jgi:D-beta-D-heptose 7-phosphate kinase/D-beta-D-heptose 1-phosphate adenosyltransferase